MKTHGLLAKVITLSIIISFFCPPPVLALAPQSPFIKLNGFAALREGTEQIILGGKKLTSIEISRAMQELEPKIADLQKRQEVAITINDEESNYLVLEFRGRKLLLDKKLLGDTEPDPEDSLAGLERKKEALSPAHLLASLERALAADEKINGTNWQNLPNFLIFTCLDNSPALCHYAPGGCFFGINPALLKIKKERTPNYGFGRDRYSRGRGSFYDDGFLYSGNPGRPMAEKLRDILLSVSLVHGLKGITETRTADIKLTLALLTEEKDEDITLPTYKYQLSRILAKDSEYYSQLTQIKNPRDAWMVPEVKLAPADMEGLKTEYPGQLLSVIEPLLPAGEIQLEVSIANGQLRQVRNQTKEKGKKFVSRRLRSALQELFQHRHYLPQPLTDGNYQLSISPLFFLKPILLQYALRHQLDLALNREKMDQESAEKQARQNDRYFFADLSYPQQLHLLWSLSLKNPAGIRGYHRVTIPGNIYRESEDIFTDLAAIFANRQELKNDLTSRDNSVLWSIIKTQTSKLQITYQEKDYPSVAGISLKDILELPALVLKLKPDELALLQAESHRLSFRSLEAAYQRSKNNENQLANLFLFLAGSADEKHLELTAKIFAALLKKHKYPYLYKPVSYFILAFREPSSFVRRDNFISYFSKKRYSGHHSRSFSLVLTGYFQDDVREEKDFSPAWQRELEIFTASRKDDNSFKMPDFVKDYIIASGSRELRAQIGDFSWVAGQVTLLLFRKYKDTFKQVPSEFIDRMTKAYWAGTAEIKDNKETLIALIGSDPRARAVKFLKQIVVGRRTRTVKDKRHDDTISLRERKKALQIYADRLGRQALPQLLEWIKDEDVGTALEELILEKISTLLSYEEILNSLTNPATAKKEQQPPQQLTFDFVATRKEDYTHRYRRTITTVEQAIAHLDVFWDRLVLRQLKDKEGKDKEMSRNKSAFQDVREALEEVKTLMPLARKMKFHLLQTDEWVLYTYGNFIFISEGALRAIRRKSSLILALAHEIAHREQLWTHTLQRIKSNKDFEKKTDLNFIKKFIFQKKLGTFTFAPQEDDDADRRAIAVATQLGYTPDEALTLNRDMHTVRELSSGATSGLLKTGHHNHLSRVMNMQGEALPYQLALLPEQQKEDCFLRFVREEKDKTKSVNHAFDATRSRWESAPKEAREQAIAGWLHYIREYLRETSKVKYPKKYHPVGALKELQDFYQEFRPLWLKKDEMILDLIPLDLIDQVVAKDPGYQSFAGLRKAYQELGMIHRPLDLTQSTRTAQVLYHLSQQTLYPINLQQWLRLIQGIRSSGKNDLPSSTSDLIIHHAQALLPAFRFGLELARERNSFGKSLEQDLLFLRQLAGLPTDKETFSKYQKPRGYHSESSIRDKFQQYYDDALRELIDRHNISLIHKEKREAVAQVLSYSLDPVGIALYIYRKSVRRKKNPLRKAKTLFQLLEFITYPHYSSLKSTISETVLEEEARTLYSELQAAGLLTDKLQKKFHQSFKQKYYFSIGYYEETVKQGLINQLANLTAKEDIAAAYLAALARQYNQTYVEPGKFKQSLRYDTQTFINLGHWVITEKLDYDPLTSLPIIAGISKVIKEGEAHNLVDDELTEKVNKITQRLFDNLFRQIEEHPEDTFNYEWFDNLYKDIIDIGNSLGFTKELLDSFSGPRFQTTLTRLVSFPNISKEERNWSPQGEAGKQRAKRFYRYPDLQAAAYRKKKKVHQQQFGPSSFDRDLDLLLYNMEENETRDELLMALVNSHWENLSAEKLALLCQEFSKDGIDYRQSLLKEGIRRILAHSHPILLGDCPPISSGDRHKGMGIDCPPAESCQRAINYILRHHDTRSKYRDELLDYLLARVSLSKEQLLRYETLKSRFGGEAVKEAEGFLFIKNLELISQLEPEKKLEFLLWIKDIGPRPSYFTTEGRAETTSYTRMDKSLRHKLLNEPENSLGNADRFNREFNRLHPEDRKRFFTEILGRPDGILSDHRVKQQFIAEEIWQLLETVEKNSPEGQLITIYLEEADPLTSARVLARMLDISFTGLNNYERLALLLQTIGFIGDKTAQWFSVRLESPAARQAFRDAQRRPRPFSKLAAVKILEEEWGRPMAEVLKNGLGQELGYGSSKGVWEAELLDGTKVAVSVQRPKFTLEINYQQHLVNKVLDRFRQTGYGHKYGGLIAETMDVNQAMLAGESDLRSELREYTRLRETLEDIQLPKVLPEWTSQRVAVTELVSSSTRLNEVEDTAIRKKATQTVITAMIRQLIHHGTFHADPWPSNILVTPDEQVSFIDFAVGGQIPEEHLDTFIDLIKAILIRDIQKIQRQLERLTASNADPRRIPRKNIVAFIDKLTASRRIVDMWINLLELLHKNNRAFTGSLRVEFAKLLRTLGILEGLEQSANLRGYLLGRLLIELGSIAERQRTAIPDEDRTLSSSL